MTQAPKEICRAEFLAYGQERGVCQLDKGHKGSHDNTVRESRPTFAYDLAMYLTKNGRELTIEEMQYRIENFVYRSCWEVRTK